MRSPLSVAAELAPLDSKHLTGLALPNLFIFLLILLFAVFSITIKTFAQECPLYSYREQEKPKKHKERSIKERNIYSQLDKEGKQLAEVLVDSIIAREIERIKVK